jgi:transposase
MPILRYNWIMAIKGRRSTPEERARAVQLVKSGEHPDRVAEYFQTSRAMVYRWVQKYDSHGASALETKKAKGPSSRLTDEQKSEIFRMIVNNNPDQLELEDFALWTRKLVRDLIRRKYGVKLSEVQVGRILRDMGLSPQRPLYRACQKDPDRMEEWKTIVYPRIRERARSEGAAIFFGDEASVKTNHHAGTTWAPVGQTPLIEVSSGKREAINMVSAISPLGEVRFQVDVGRMNAGRFIEFLKALKKTITGKKIFLIVDGSSVHKAKKVTKFLEEQAEDGNCIELFILPPYSPELNPDEWVWNNIKNSRIGRQAVRSREDLKSKAISALRRLQKLPDLVRGFFLDPNLAYIRE